MVNQKLMFGCFLNIKSFIFLPVLLLSFSSIFNFVVLQSSYDLYWISASFWWSISVFYNQSWVSKKILLWMAKRVLADGTPGGWYLTAPIPPGRVSAVYPDWWRCYLSSTTSSKIRFIHCHSGATFFRKDCVNVKTRVLQRASFDRKALTDYRGWFYE